MATRKICKNLMVPRKTSRGYELIFSKNGMAIDITDWTIYFTAKKRMEDADNDAVIKKDITSHSDPTNGKSLIQLTTDDTDLQGSYFFDIKYKDDIGNAGILVDGRILFKETVTSRG